MKDIKNPQIVNIEAVKNIYQRLSINRAELQKAELKKSGENKFTHYTYYELGDFLPTVNKLNNEYGLTTRFLLKDKLATLLLQNVDNPEDKITFEIPVKDAGVKGASDIQNLGAQITYLRRYLLMIAYEIAEGDIIEKSENKEAKEENELSQIDLDKINGATSLEQLNVIGKDLTEKLGEKYRNSILKAYSTKKTELNKVTE